MILCTIITYSCSSLPSYQIDYDTITKKTTIQEFTEQYEKSIEATFPVKLNSNEYTVYSIEMITTKIQAQSTTNKFGKIRYSNNAYFFIFNDNHYFHSGYLYELLNNNDDEIKNIGLMIANGEKGN